MFSDQIFLQVFDTGLPWFVKVQPTNFILFLNQGVRTEHLIAPRQKEQKQMVLHLWENVSDCNAVCPIASSE